MSQKKNLFGVFSSKKLDFETIKLNNYKTRKAM